MIFKVEHLELLFFNDLTLSMTFLFVSLFDFPCLFVQPKESQEIAMTNFITITMKNFDFSELGFSTVFLESNISKTVPL